MIRTKVLASALAVTSVSAIVSAAHAQDPSQSYQPQMMPSATPDADALAAAMRRLAENPRDLNALIAAGELSLKVGDASGAAALFKRAEGVDPMNGRIKAGMARILVTQERPGEALRYFDQAVGYGLDPRTFAGDRGLAFDLIGEQERAQRDYRLALKTADSDEVRRRYALSLGISGKQDSALAEIDTLLRRGDRGAWRARAFILAMTGDVPGATSIATRMMPPGMAQGLQPFFVRLPTLVPIDKAFAVHFGEVRATPERLADARLVPVLPVLGPDPDQRVRVATVATVPVVAPVRPRERRRRGSTPQVLVATAAPRVTTLPPAPGFGNAGEAPTDPARAAAGAVVGTPVAVAAPTRVANAPVAPAPVRFARQQIDPIQKPTLADYARVERINRARQQQAERTLTGAGTVPVGGTVAPPTGTAALVAELGRRAPAPVVMLAAAPQAVEVSASPAQVGGPVPSAAAASAPTVATTSSSVPTPLRASEGSILARIIAGLSVPGEELGVGSAPASPPQVVASVPAPAPPAVATVAARPRPAAAVARRAADPLPVAVRARVAPADAAPPARKAARTRAVAVADADPSPRGAPAVRPATKRGRQADPEQAVEPATEATRERRRGTDRRVVADKDADARVGTRNASSRRTLPAATDDRADRRSRRDDAKAARAEPPRIWVQVAGGANQGDLPKAWSAVQSRAPALKGRAAYSTPLRATNRVVTGPFKTDAEARAFVNQLAKQGVAAFPFTSDKGQKLAKLPPR